MKRAVIIGATSGIGKEVARILLSKGWKVGISGRRKICSYNSNQRRRNPLNMK